MNITQHEPDLVNEDILADLVADFDGFLKERRFSECESIIDNLRDLKQFSKGIELMKRLTAARMRVPDGYGDENVHFRDEDNPLNGVQVEGFEEDTVY